MPAGAHLLIWITFNHSIYFILPIPGVKLPCPRPVKIGLVNSCIYYAHQTWNLPGAALLSGFKRSRNPLNKTALCNGNGNKIQWNLNQNILLFFYALYALENVVWKMAAILSRPQCVKWNMVRIALFVTQAILDFLVQVVGRADSGFALSQWETSLQSNAVSHWLGANLESALVGAQSLSKQDNGISVLQSGNIQKHPRSLTLYILELTVSYFTKIVNLSLLKPPLKFNGG